MRNAFADEVTALAKHDPKIVLLCGDIGNRLFDKFKAAHPDRFFNVGVAEADMIGIAAGMALTGLRPVVYTIASFAIYRCFEQIRVDLCYHRANVVIVGVGAGLGYAANGPTHHSCEDLAVLRALPNMTILCPADAWEVRSLLAVAVGHSDPVYLRIGKKGEPLVHQERPKLAIGDTLELRSGSDVALLTTGTIVPEVLQAADALAHLGLSAAVIHLPTVKPLPIERLRAVFAQYKLVVTIEEHSRIGGCGAAVAEWLADEPQPPTRLLRLGTPDTFLHEAGEQEHARAAWGLTPNALAQTVRATYVSL